MIPIQTQSLNANEESDVARAAQLILARGLVALPTETVYGLGALALDDEAVRKIFAAKERPEHNPLIVHVSNATEAAALFDFSQCSNSVQSESWFRTLSEHFWPGPLTLVCRKNTHVGDGVTAGLPKVAVRVPSHPAMRQVLALTGAPIAAPSANLSSRPSPTNAEHVLRTLAGKIDAVLDGGPCTHGLESSVVDISGETPILLRAGALSLGALRALIPSLAAMPIGQTTHQATGSPGLTAKHYAPQIHSVKLASPAQIKEAWHSPAALLIRQGLTDVYTAQMGIREGVTETLSDDESLYAQQFYAALYRLEQRESEILLIEETPSQDESSLWRTIQDRLLRASSG